MTFPYRLSAALIGAAIVVVQPQLATALTKEEVNAIAREITVRIDGEDIGSGVIFERKGNTYYVLTNHHVVKEPGRYEIKTPDGDRHTVYYSDKVSGLDLVVLRFESNKTYRTANLGNSDQMTEATTIYVAGWDSDREFQFSVGQITSRLQNSRNGYSLKYTNPTVGGTSGGPILDEDGKVVGINGQVDSDDKTGRLFSLGIPIKSFLTARNNLKPLEESSPIFPLGQSENRTAEKSPVATPPAPSPTSGSTLTREQTPSPTPTLISAVTGVDYSPLQNLLAAEKWREANRKTRELMLKAAGRESEGWFNNKSLQEFSCSDLKTIDRLWVKYSDGRFGFSVQNSIYLETGNQPGKLDYNAYVRFGDRLGWRSHGRWRNNYLSFNLNAPRGHLPEIFSAGIYRWLELGGEHILFSRCAL